MPVITCWEVLLHKVSTGSQELETGQKEKGCHIQLSCRDLHGCSCLLNVVTTQRKRHNYCHFSAFVIYGLNPEQPRNKQETSEVQLDLSALITHWWLLMLSGWGEVWYSSNAPRIAPVQLVMLSPKGVWSVCYAQVRSKRRNSCSGHLKAWGKWHKWESISMSLRKKMNNNGFH